MKVLVVNWILSVTEQITQFHCILYSLYTA